MVELELFYSCRCNYHCTSERRSLFVREGCCMCSVGALRLQTGIQEEDILYMRCENAVRICFNLNSVCLIFSVLSNTDLQYTVLCVPRSQYEGSCSVYTWYSLFQGET